MLYAEAVILLLPCEDHARAMKPKNSNNSNNSDRKSLKLPTRTFRMLLMLLVSLAFNTALAAVNYQLLHSFGAADQLGVSPKGALIEGTNGFLYGMTSAGGTINAGVVFRILKDGTGYKALHHFGTPGDASSPWFELLQTQDGMLYGTANAGGAYGNGAIFRLDPSGSTYELVYSFTNAANSVSSLVEGNDGGLYGTTYGGYQYSPSTVFRVNKDGSGYAVLHTFTNNSDYSYYGRLFKATEGYFYGTTLYGGANGNGTVYRISSDGTFYQVLHTFKTVTNDGHGPIAGVFEATDGVLYGTTLYGGTNDFGGTVFKMNKDGSGYAVIHTFARTNGYSPAASLIEGADGLLYGTAQYGGASGGDVSGGGGVVFKISKDGGTSYTTLHNFATTPLDGDTPIARLLQGSDGRFYGMTASGGGVDKPFGTVFSITADGSVYSVMHRFSHTGNDANNPKANLLQASDGSFYGTAASGGSNSFNWGMIFKINRDGSGYSTVRSFDGSHGDGQNPAGPVIEGSDGMLYGTTSNGGSNDVGTVFKMRKDATGYTLIHSFSTNNLDGRQPHDGVIQGKDGYLYGSTQLGGSNGSGTVFKMKTDGTAYQILHSFGLSGGDGTRPFAGLIEASDGLLYGTTYYVGTVFRLSKDGSSYSILHSFPPNGGPYDKVIEASDGVLYGVSPFGGTSTMGIVFRMNKDGSGYSVIKTFTGGTSDGSTPFGPLVEGNDGDLYGNTQQGGSSGFGTVFKLSKDGTRFAILLSYIPMTGIGIDPYAGLTKGNDGAFYGVARAGGDLGRGTVFRLWPSEAPTMMKIELPGSAYVTLSGVPGLQYSVFRSVDLSAWFSLYTIVMPALGLYTNVDANPPSPAAYYRAAYVP